MSATLIILAHPRFHLSNINKVLLDCAIQTGTHFLDLYETYPDFYIDAEIEQKRLLKYHNIILQFPLHWYSCPALLQEYLDTVLEKGWAFGEGGKALHGKNLICCVTTGGSKYSFSKRGHNNHTMNEFLFPFAQTASTCQMNFQSPFVVYKAHHLEKAEINEYCEDYKNLLEILNNLSE